MFPKVNQKVRLRKEFVDNHIKWLNSRDTFYYGNAWNIDYTIKRIDSYMGQHYVTLDKELFRPMNPSDPPSNSLFVDANGRFYEGTVVFEDAGIGAGDFTIEIVWSSTNWPVKHLKKEPDEDICKLCGGVGKIDRMACICSKCGNVIWGC